MEEKDLRMQRRRADGDDHVYYPLIRGANVKMTDGVTVEAKVTVHLAETATQMLEGGPHGPASSLVTGMLICRQT